MNEEQSDEALMLAYVGGDVRAFDRLFERYAPVILGIGRRHLRNEDDARELLQKTFLRLHGARRDYRPSQPLHPWLMTITMNLVRDSWRRSKRKPVSPLQEEPTPPEADASEGEPLDAGRRAEMLRAALRELPPGQREVIELHWLQERPYAEVAEIVGSSEGAVRVRAHRAYAKLKARLSKLLEDE
ncbi:MAG: sigma-70 family RNA polymerase sigma factor [Myxococcales bacterium]|nr:sigma-70 family RNA polymerase sigma factor [Myxococcales bacterium]